MTKAQEALEKAKQAKELCDKVNWLQQHVKDDKKDVDKKKFSQAEQDSIRLT